MFAFLSRPHDAVMPPTQTADGGSHRRTRRTVLVLASSVTAAVLASASPAQAEYRNWALNGTYQLSSIGVPCTLGSGPDNAVDGAASNIYTDKWCVRGAGKLMIRLKLDYTSRCGIDVDKFVVKHAGAAGENPFYNTRAFTIRTTRDDIGMNILFGGNAAYTVTDNAANVTTIPAGGAAWATQWVTLDITTPEQARRLVEATRIYELEVWGWPSQSCPS